MPKQEKTAVNKKPETAKSTAKGQTLNKLKGGSYIKDPETSERTLVQKTERKKPQLTAEQ
jgi:hypothetical protein